MTDNSNKDIKSAIACLVNVKSIVTIILTIGFMIQACLGSLTPEFQSVYLVVISFYFGTQYQKSVGDSENASIR